MASYYSPKTRQTLAPEEALYEDVELPHARRQQAQAKTEKDAVIDALTQQILSQGTTSKWSGEGFGSAEANARDMAKILAETGITDIKQFGQFEVPDSKEVFVVQESDEWSGSGTGKWYFVNGAGDKVYVDPNTVYPRDVWEGDGISTQAVVSIPSTKVVYGNKDTKQAVAITYGERRPGGAWGGTYAGKGNTGYRVQFGPDGTPYFYTTGHSSSDLQDFAPLLQLAALIPSPIQPYAQAANAAIAIYQGDIFGGLASIASIPGVSEAAKAAELGSVVSGLRTASDIDKAVKAFESGDIVGAGLRAAGIAGVKELAGYDINDVKKAVNLGMAIKNAEQDPMALVRAGSAFAPKDVYGHDPSMLKEGSFRYNDVFDPKTAGLVDLSEQPIEGYEFTKDFTPGVGLDLFPDLQGPGIKAPPMETDVFRPDGSVNYDIFDFEGYKGEPGLEMPRAPNMPSMGGGQGFVVPVEGGVMTESGFIPTGYTPDLGDPSSFINKPAPGAEVSGSVQKALDAGAAATAKDINKAGQTKSQTQQQSGSGIDFAGLLGLLGSLGGQQAPSVLAVPENSADIKLMEEIFGTSLSAPSTGTETDKAEAIARLLRS